MKISFTAILDKFDRQGEKTGWTYISIPKKLTDKLNPGVKKSYRVKGKLDQHDIKAVALIPIGDGHFIMAVNAAMRKAIRKQKGAEVQAEIEMDKAAIKLSKELLDCLRDEPVALAEFKKLPPSHQHYYSKWIESAKTDLTKTKRITQAVDALAKKISYGEMLRAQEK